MPRIFRRHWIVLVFASWMGSAAAGPITDTISVDGRDWAQVDLFAGHSWNDINAVCPGGVCGNGTLNGYDLVGWSWASVGDVQALFNTYIGSPQLGPGVDSYHETDSPWAPAFFAAGWRPNVAGFPPGNNDIIALFGLTSTCVSPPGCANHSWLWWTWGAGVPGPDSAVTGYPKDANSPRGGAWFVRGSDSPAIPITATLPLFGLGLAALLVSRRKY